MKKYLLLSVLYILHISAFSQEVLSPMEVNPVIKNYIMKNGVQSVYRSGAASVPLPLPFLEDFSSTDIFPSTLQWLDNKVFINSSMPRNMPTVGVATFDGLDEFGSPYVVGGTNAGSADVLTSQPLQLFTKPGGGNYVVSDNIYISFYFEKQGYGDEPEGSDSLVLEFFRPSLQTWTRNWFSLGNVPNGSGEDTTFNKVDLLITDSTYLQDGFQLRFHSYGNLSGSLDNWHIDYVKVYSAADSLGTVVDQAFTSDRTSDLETFTAIPWKHYKNSGAGNQPALIKDNSTVNYTVFHDQASVNAGFSHSVFAPDLSVVHNSSSGLFPVSSNSRLSYTYGITYQYDDTKELNDNASYFDVVDYFSSALGGDNIVSNDTIRYRQHFTNYYSYDDGTCENGYDLQNAPSGKIAVQYNMLQSDTLRGVQIFFAQQNADVSNKLITLKVWSSLGPEVVLYQVPSQHPTYVDSINGFATYVFPSPLPVTNFYIGFQQVSADLMHVGFDRNTTNNSKMFYNISGTWSNVGAAPGSLMIRPLVGSVPLVSINENNSVSSTVKCYPNPSTGSVYISSENTDIYNMVKVSDLSGRIVFENNFHAGWFNLFSLNSGVYTVQLVGEKVSSVPQKLIINK